MDSTDIGHLRRCLELARDARAAGNEPFGSLLVGTDGTLLAERQNTVGSGDVTGHPELALASWASTHLTPSERRAATVYTSCEHCAMCAGAHYWAGIGRLVFALSGAQLAAIVPSGGPALDLSCREVFARGNVGIEVDGPCPELVDEALALFDGLWAPSATPDAGEVEPASPWSAFAAAEPELAAFAADRLRAAPGYLATVRADGSARVHPVTPVVTAEGLFVFMEPTSPKGRDLRERPWYALHNGVPDMNGTGGEVSVRGRGLAVDDADVRTAVAAAAPYDPADRYVLFELLVADVRANGYGDVALPERRSWSSRG